jgi:sulfatase maturation enzyme AslB (radical SAM superfamily)
MDFKSLVKSNQICSVPWTHLDISLGGRVVPCCRYRGDLGTPDKIVEIWSGEKMKSLRHNFLHGQGVKSPACSKCDTDSDVRSMIHIKNNIALYLGLVDDIDLENPKLPSAATISLNNTCNLSCRMCTPLFSSRVAETVKKSPLLASMIHSQPSVKSSVDTLNEILPNLKFVSFLGGEPFYNKDFIQILTRLKEQAKDLKAVVITTNMTILNIPILEELKSIDKVRLIISIDGPEQIHNYIREGADYKTIIDNIKFVSKNYPMIKLMIADTIGALNVGYIPEFIECINDLKNNHNIDIEAFNNNLVFDPVPLHPASLPEHVKNMYREKLNNFNESNHIIMNSRNLIASGLYLLNLPSKPSDDFYKFITEYDRVLETDYKLVYSEF